MKKIFLISVITIFGLLLGCSSPEKVRKDPSKIVAPFDGKKFNNIEPFSDKSFFTVLWWRLKRAFTAESWPDETPQVFFEPETSRSKELKVSVIGHATALIQVDNINILTDPHFSKRASPISWAGPKRVVKPGIPFEKLPPIDIVVISHDHYDALDIPTLKRISKKWGSKIFVGLGNLPLLKESNINNVFEMDWWDRVSFNDIDISFVPVQHWSARSTGDKRETLWGGFVIHGSKQIFFAGDTGYGTGKVFNMIHQKFGDMDLSLIPIGAYRPRYFMKNAHVWPAESVKIFLDTKSKKAIGIHFGTFANLTDEAIDDPPKDLKKALIENNISQERFIVPEFGRTYSF
jgi:L-ascorbate metabolism protein UlaG (beta-lactamase superfamily)